MVSEETVFAEAVRLAANARSAYLDQACGDDANLRRSVEELLAAHEHSRGLLESPATAMGVAAASAPTEQPGTVVGRYKLLEPIGEGGMGVVYMAEQERPVRRRVALKIIKPGLDTRQVIARFEAERQALALMDHPNIAKVLDAGATDAGRPYFVMELVRGIPVTDYCDQHQLTPRQRLELFVQVCQAVQHAHTKGMIHRDIKPTNVLVTVADDGRPVPKVIDFGVAKATAGQRLTDHTLFTEFRQLVGTPLYMSPEQAEMSVVTDVDMRSDVYSLGVLLYELLTGTTPFDKKRLAKAAYDEVRRIIREEEPPRPSTRLGTLGDALVTVSASRHTDPGHLSHLVRGDLDWIVMKCLEKDRARRYETANELAFDVARHLSNEPVHASPPSRVYRLRKFARRNRAALAAAAAMVVLLVAGITGTTIGMLRARTAKDHAMQLLEQVEKSKTEAERAAGRAQALSKFLGETLGAANPFATGERDVRVVDVLDRAAKRLSDDLAGQPEAEFEARMVIGRSYQGLGLYEKGLANFSRAHDLARDTYGPEKEPTLRAATAQAWLMIQTGNYREAEPLARNAMETAKSVLGTADPITWEASKTYGWCFTNPWLQHSPDQEAKLAQSLPLKRELVEWIRRAPGGPHKRELAGALHAESLVLADLGGGENLVEAEKLQREVMELIKDDPQASLFPRYHMHLAQVLRLRNNFEDSKREFQRALADQRKHLGETHPDTLRTKSFYAHMLIAKGDYADAADVYEELIRLLKGGKTFGYVPHNTMLARMLIGLAQARLGLNQPDAALRAANDVLELPTSGDDPRPGHVQVAWRLRGVSHYRLGDWNAAIHAIETSMELGKGGNGFDWFVMAMARWQLGEYEDSLRWYERAVDWMQRTMPRDPALRRYGEEAAALLHETLPSPLGPRPATRDSGVLELGP